MGKSITNNRGIKKENNMITQPTITDSSLRPRYIMHMKMSYFYKKYLLVWVRNDKNNIPTRRKKEHRLSKVFDYGKLEY